MNYLSINTYVSTSRDYIDIVQQTANSKSKSTETIYNFESNV